MPEDQTLVLEYLQDVALKEYVFSNLSQSLNDIGFSGQLINDLFDLLSKGSSPKDFGTKHSDELREVYNIGFFQDKVPNYFSEYVVPLIPSVQKVIDVGCGTGILAKLLTETGRFTKVIGIDINSYPEWELFRSEKLSFEVVKEAEFSQFMSSEKPDTVLLTWTLHHMEYPEQERYLAEISSVLKSESQFLILEDSYSETLSPENGLNLHASFMERSKEDRKKIMSIYDWTANRVLAQREKIPIPFGYRTLEEWENLAQMFGFKTVQKTFIGFPDHRDINTPQSLILLEKV